MDIFSCHFNLFGQCFFPPRLNILGCFQAREFVLHVIALRSLFPDNIIDRQCSSVTLDVFLSLEEFNVVVECDLETSRFSIMDIISFDFSWHMLWMQPQARWLQTDQESKLPPALFCRVFNLPHPGPSWKGKRRQRKEENGEEEDVWQLFLKEISGKLQNEISFIYYWPEFSPHVTSRQAGNYSLFSPLGFSGSSVVKNGPTSAGDIGDVGLIPVLGGSPGEGNGNALQYSCLENSVDRVSKFLLFTHTVNKNILACSIYWTL